MKREQYDGKRRIGELCTAIDDGRATGLDRETWVSSAQPTVA